MENGTYHTVKYTDSKNQVSQRDVVILDQPQHYRVIDITDLPVNEQVDVQRAVEEYVAYRNLLEKQVLSFERWLSQTNTAPVSSKPLKHRRLVADRVQVL